MIFDPRYWKNDLKRIAEELHHRRIQRRWTDASYAALEKSIMIGFYAIRRLSEAFQPTDLPTSVQLLEFFPKSKKLSILHWPSLEDHFDLSSPKRISQSLLFICHQIIHSHVFRAHFDEGGKLAGIFFCSDKEKEKRLFLMGLDTIIVLFENLAEATKGPIRLRFAPYSIRDCRRTQVG